MFCLGIEGQKIPVTCVNSYAALSGGRLRVKLAG
jgi:hypothetical protein